MKGFGDEKKSKKKILNQFQIKQYQNQLMLKAFKYHSEGNISEAKKYYKYLIKEGFKDERVFNNYGMILLNSGDLRQAKIFISKVIELNPNDSVAYSNLGGISKELGELKDAELLLRKTIELNPNFANAYLSLGRILYDLGKLKESELIILKAIELNPDFAGAYYSLSNIGELTNQKKWIDYLFTEDILERQDDFNKIDIYFARANILERQSNYIQSANMLRKANDLNRELYGSNYTKIKNRMKNYYQIWRGIKAKKEMQENQLTSIFIVGLPRSGKTITESILACNKSVLQCGEDKALSIAVDKYLNPKENQNNQDLYQIYLANITKEISGKSFICSTMPNNFIYTGLIANQIPNSKIVYCYRNPLDNIKDIYCAHFGKKFTFTTSLVESANILLSINELMEEYRMIFNSKIFFLNYDKLVVNPEKEIKSLISWLGWEYEQKYLHPKLDPTTYIRSDKKNSLLNKKYQNIWKHYQDLLKPAIEVLEESGKYQHLIS